VVSSCGPVSQTEHQASERRGRGPRVLGSGERPRHVTVCVLPPIVSSGDSTHGYRTASSMRPIQVHRTSCFFWPDDQKLTMRTCPDLERALYVRVESSVYSKEAGPRLREAASVYPPHERHTRRRLRLTGMLQTCQQLDTGLFVSASLAASEHGTGGRSRHLGPRR